jgi:hypothetical protein
MGITAPRDKIKACWNATDQISDGATGISDATNGMSDEAFDMSDATNDMPEMTAETSKTLKNA